MLGRVTEEGFIVIKVKKCYTGLPDKSTREEVQWLVLYFWRQRRKR